MSGLRVRFLRHGLTDWNREKRYLGRSDLPLSTEGKAALHPAQPGAKKVYVSPALRAVQTAAILFPEAEQVPIEAFWEMDFGAFEGNNYAEMAEDPAYRAWVDGGCEGPTPGGESRAQFCGRVCAAFAFLVEEALETGETELVIVAHGGTQMAALEAFALPEKGYFDWNARPGCGFLLKTDQALWGERHKLYWIGNVSYAEGET